MKAVVYHGPRDVRIDDKPMPEIEHGEDAIIKVTTTAICGSDLHLYHGTVTGMEPGQTLGHEFMGVVTEVGSNAVTEVKIGDRVVAPFNISCGKCWYCRHGRWSQCDRSNLKGQGGGAFGYTQNLGGYDGGQAEFVRVPFANTELLKVPENVSDERAIFLSDILPTGYFGVDIADVQAGDDVIVYGAGPVGFFAVMCAFLRGAAMVISVDCVKARLEKTEKLGAVPVDFNRDDPVEVVNDLTKGKGGICIDCVGYEALGHNHRSSEEAGISNPAYPNEYPMQVFEWMSQTASKFSTLGIPGVYNSSYCNFPLGQLFQKEVQIRMGQCPVKNYNEQLLHLIEKNRIDPTLIISHVMKLDEAPKAYSMFDQKDGCTKVIMHP
ncbi:MAG TPA: alcohol dehydrogenase catalytic domain-containing protein [Candidatus Omnitrophota bacterium]|nr:alcohol dehydrogenase catalytic domain-containing protein [Candidatus Omnitrophota bacterium]